MANVAFEKTIEEQVTNAASATDGQITGYTGNTGFAAFRWPGTFTVDLGEVHRLSCIRMLLWDGLGQPGGIRNPRLYFYRLLTSIDHQTWQVVYDTVERGSNGWQVFNFPDGIESRYVRVHGMLNTANPEFHIVQLEAHDSKPPPAEAEVMVQRYIAPDTLTEEVGDGLPLESGIRDIIGGIEKLIDEPTSVLKPEPFKDLISQLRVQVRDVGAIERSMDSIRREIVGPVNEELQKSAKVGRFSLWIGIIGGGLAIISIVMNLIILKFK